MSLSPPTGAGEAGPAILLVDDDREMLSDLGALLRSRLGGACDVRVAAEGETALGLLATAPVAALVTDLKMPGMDGWELQQRAAEACPDVPVIVITGYATPETEGVLRGRGAAAVLAKPFLVGELVRLLRELLGRETEGGVVRGISPPLFLQIVEMEQKTCTVRLDGRPGALRGVLFFREGALIDARLGSLRGEAAAREILSWDQAVLKIENACAVRERAIRRDLHGLMIDAACRRDEREAEGEGGAASGGGEPQAASPAGDAGLPAAVAQTGPPRRDPLWAERARRLSRLGERLGLGGLIGAFLDRGEERDFLLGGGADPWVAEIPKGTPRDTLLPVPEG